MLIMKWETDHEGRLVAAWKETRRSGTAACRIASAEALRQHAPSLPEERMGNFIDPHVRAWKSSIIGNAIRTTRMLLCHILDLARALDWVRGR